MPKRSADVISGILRGSSGPDAVRDEPSRKGEARGRKLREPRPSVPTMCLQAELPREWLAATLLIINGDPGGFRCQLRADIPRGMGGRSLRGGLIPARLGSG